MGIALIALLFITTVFLVVLLHIYFYLPLQELRRRARSADKTYRLIYKSASFGNKLRALLWLIIGLLFAWLVVILGKSLPMFVAVLLSAMSIWLAFAVIPMLKVDSYMLKTAGYVSPIFHWILETLEPVFRHLGIAFGRLDKHAKPDRLFEKDDIIELLQNQEKQEHNRITKQELDIAVHALQFGDKKVADIMTPKRAMKTVSSVDMIGPVLMGELHKSGHTRFPVYKDNPGNIVGMLYLHDVVAAKAGGFVKDVMKPKVYYVHEKHNLAGVFSAFLKTKHHLYLVVNNFEEIIGLITIEDILEQILGKQIVDEFDQYDDIRAVTIEQANKDRQNNNTMVESDEVTEEEVNDKNS